MERPLPPEPLKVLLAPRNEENPYLPHLRDALVARGSVVEWFESESTPSQTVNALLAPWALWRRRREGFTVLHLHWVYKFAWPSVASIPLLRRLPRLWFSAFLAFARAMGFTVVYTWHDVVPVVKAFDDDAKSRTAIVRHLDRVVTITDAAKRAIEVAFDVPGELVDVIPEGSPEVLHRIGRDPARAALAVERDVLVSGFGHIADYKGFDLLLDAVSRLPAQQAPAIRLLGAAADRTYAARLAGLVDDLRRAGHDVRWSDRTYSDEELGALLSATDVVALPFRRITNSATLRFAIAWGATVLLPRIDALADVPQDAAVWSAPGDVDDLASVLRDLVEAWPQGAEERAAIARAWVNEWSWDAVGTATMQAYEAAQRHRHPQEVSRPR